MSKFNISVIAMSVVALSAGVYQYLETSDRSLSPAISKLSEQKILKGPKPYDKPKEANDFYLEKRLPRGETVLPVEKYQLAKTHIDRMARHSAADSLVLPSRFEMMMSKAAMMDNEEIGEWENIGPGNIGGRTRSLLIDPSQPNTMYIGGVAGGVWKTTDGGRSWSPLDDLMANLAISTMEFDPADSTTIYAGTGEGFFNGDAVRGNGIFVSNDAGASWSQLPSTNGNSDFSYVNKLVVSPNDSNTLYAATRTGVHKSTDGGTTWSAVYSPNIPVGCTDLKIRTDQTTDFLLTSCGSFTPGQIARSTDAGTNWTVVLDGNNMGRSTIAIAPSNQDIMYALNAASAATATNLGANGINAVFRSDDGGENWAVQFKVDDNTVAQSGRIVATGGGFGISLLTNTLFGMLPTCGFFGRDQSFNQGWYDNIITVDPVNPDIVWAGGIDVFRSDDAGQNWGVTSIWFDEITSPFYAHADQHIQVFHPQYDGADNAIFFLGNDGGIQKTSNARSSTLSVQEYCDFLFGAPLPTPETDYVNWERLNNGLGITQFYNGDTSADGTIYLAGAQDNGTNLGNDTLGTEGWFEVSGGDGGYAAIDPTDTNILFTEFTGLSLQKSVDGGQNFVGATNGITGGGFPFITTFEMDKNNPQRLWILGNEIWRTDDQAANWVQASLAPTDGSSGRAVAIANTNSDHVMVGTNSGRILRNTDAGNANAATQWAETQVANGSISSISYDPTDEQIAYATVSTFGANHVWKSVDGGVSWSAIDNMGQANGIPDIPAHSVAVDSVDNQRVFVGTDLGVFVSIDGGANWMVENSGFANTPTETLKFVGRKLFAFTHGRGAYRVDLIDLLRVDNFTATLDEDTTASWTSAEITGAINNRPNTGALVNGIQITQYPQSGSLRNGTDTLASGSTIPLASLTTLEYVPNTDFFGTDTFSWAAVENSTVVSRDSMVELTVSPVNDAPVVTLAIPSFSSKTGSTFDLDLNNYISDVDSDITFTLGSLPNELSVSSNGRVTGKFDNSFNGTITVTASDGTLQVETSFNLKVKKSLTDKLGGSLGGSLFLLLVLMRLRKRS